MRAIILWLPRLLWAWKLKRWPSIYEVKIICIDPPAYVQLEPL